MLNIPRVVIAAAASGQGKTTLAVGLMAALTRAGHPALAAHFAGAVAAFASSAVVVGSGAQASARTRPPRTVGAQGHLDHDLDSLDHHGDVEVGDGLVDLAVNVRDTSPPPWLAERITASLQQIARYPSADAARGAIARRHGLPDGMVLPTNGAAEAFTLIARAFAVRRPVVVHPQFTEPDSALRRAGLVPEHVILSEHDGFLLHPAAVPEEADLVVIGNPTNPTGVLHPRAVLRSLRRPGRILVVDEAFADAVPGDAQSLIGSEMDDVVVIRSLTKTWSIAGLRAGYLVSASELIRRLARQQPHWSVSTPAAAAMEATASPAAVSEAARGAVELQQWRDVLVAELHRIGLQPVVGRAPFVLVRAGVGVREALRERGFAVRSCTSFPGLGHEWIRIAVREPRITHALIEALGGIITQETPA